MTSPPRQIQALVWIGIILLLALTSWFGWRALREAKPEEKTAGRGGFPPSDVIYQTAAEREVVEMITVTGSLRAKQRAEVAARESAAVESLDVDEGDLVEKDAVIATLDGRRLTAQHLEAEAALTAARAELTQREAEHARALQNEKMIGDLWKEEAVAEREYLDSVREMKVAAAREDAARKSIEAAEKRRDLLIVRKADLEVHAPFTGRVVARHTERGEWLREGDPVVTLVSTGELEAWLQLPERQAAALKADPPASVELRIPGQSEPIRTTKLSLIPDVEGRSRRFILVAGIPNENDHLTPGTSVEADVPLGKPSKRLVVSSDAVMRSYNGTYLMSFTPAEAGPSLSTRVPITVLFERNGEAILAPGALKAGDPVIVEGNERLRPKSPVIPHPPEAVNAERKPGGKKP